MRSPFESIQAPSMLAIAPDEIRHIADAARLAGFGIDLISSLEEDAQSDLVMLSWLGCGLYKPAEWQEARAEARAAQSWRTADYLAHMPQFADRLESGLRQLAQNAVGQSRYYH